jgi:hypothetical protein
MNTLALYASDVIWRQFWFRKKSTVSRHFHQHCGVWYHRTATRFVTQAKGHDMKTLMRQLLRDYSRPHRRRTAAAPHTGESLESRRVLSAISGQIATTLTKAVADNMAQQDDSQGSATQSNLKSVSAHVGMASVAPVPLAQHAVVQEVPDGLLAASTNSNDPITINRSSPATAWNTGQFVQVDNSQDLIENDAVHQSLRNSLIEHRDDMTMRYWKKLINKGVMSGNPG